MAKKALNIQRQPSESGLEDDKKSRRNKIVAGTIIALVAIAFLGWGVSSLSLGNLNANQNNVAPTITCNKGNNTLITDGNFEFFVQSNLTISSVLVYFNGSLSFFKMVSPYLYPVALAGVGTVSFIIVAYDDTDNRTVANFRFTYDTIPPNIYISPSNGSTTNIDEFFMTVDDDVENITIITDAYNHTFYNSSFTVSDPWTSVGTKTIVVTATDIAGNINTTTFKLTFDITAPEIIADDITNSSIIVIHIGSPYTNLVKVGNSSGSINIVVHSPYVVDMNWSTDGAYTAWAFVNTTVSMSYTISTTITLDRTAPRFTVSPTNGSTVELTSLTFTVIDANPLSITVESANITSSLVYSPVWTVNGWYTFHVIVVDRAGNVNQSILRYKLDTEAPIIALLYVVNETVISNATITVNVTDASLDKVSSSTNGTSWEILSSAHLPRFSVNLSWYFTTPGTYNVYFRANDTLGHTTTVEYRFLWSIVSNITIIHPTNKNVPVYVNPSYANFSTNKTSFLGYFKQSSFNTINFTIAYVTNASWVYIYYQNVTGSESAYNQATMNSTFVLLHNAWASHSSSYKPFTIVGSIFSMSATTYLGGNSSWRIYVYYNTGVDEVIGTFVIVYDDKTPIIYWTLANGSTSKLNQNTYINFTTTDINLASMHVLVKITNTSGTFVLYNVTVYGSKQALFGLNFTQIESRLSYTMDVDVVSTDLAGNIQTVHLHWKVDAKNTPNRNYWNYLYGLGIPVVFIFAILGYAIRKSKNNGSHVGGT